MAKKEKELTVDAEEITKDPATFTREELYGVPAEVDAEAPEGTAKEYHGSELPDEVSASGIGIGFTSGLERGSSLGIRGEDDESNNSMQKKSE